MADDVYQELRNHPDLPTANGVAMEILRLAADEDCDINELSQLVETDPATASRILHIVNSPLFGVSQQITSIPQAIAFLGLRMVKYIALSFSLVSRYRQGRCENFDYQRFWSESLGIAVAGRHLALINGTLPPDEVLACGLLSQVGQLAFASLHPEVYSDVLGSAENLSDQELLELEQATFKIDHNQLTARLMEDWKLPKAFCEVARIQDAPELQEQYAGTPIGVLAQLTKLAHGLARLLVEQTPTTGDVEAVEQHAQLMGVSKPILNQVFERTRMEWKEAGELFNVNTRMVPSLSTLSEQARKLQSQLEPEPELESE